LVARDADEAVNTMLDAMTDALAGGQRIEIRGFGSFALNYRPPRVGRNPKSGDRVQVPAKYVPHQGRQGTARAGSMVKPVRTATAKTTTDDLWYTRPRLSRPFFCNRLCNSTAVALQSPGLAYNPLADSRR
jgi:nucleoid DNA-binding protein